MIAAATLAFLFGHHKHHPPTRPTPRPRRPPPTLKVQRIARPFVPLCVTAEAKLLQTLDSRRYNAGDTFAFKLVGAVVGHGDVPDLVAGTPGYGVISFAMHARMAGGAGFFVLEPRFLALHGGHRLPAMADPRLDDQVVAGTSGNAPDVLGFVPIVGWVTGGYNALHRGKEVVVPAGTQLRLVLGDDLVLKRCADPPASDVH